MTQYPHSW